MNGISIPVPFFHRLEFRWLCWLFILGMYISQRSPHPGFHDSLSYLADAATGFHPETNATSHFLYNNFQHLLVLLFSGVAGPVFILSWVSVVFGLLTLFKTERIVFELTGSAVAGLFSALMLAFSFTFWQQSETLEVYAMSNFFFAGLLLHGLRYLRTHTARSLFTASCWMALGLLIHIQHILCFPFLLLLIFLPSPVSIPRKALSFLMPALALTFLCALPFFTGTHPVSAVFFDSGFQEDVLGFSGKKIAMGMAVGLAYLLYNFHLWLIPAFAGLRGLFRSDKLTAVALLVFALPHAGFGAKYGVSDNHVYFLPAWIVCAVLAGDTFARAAARAKNWLRPVAIMLVAGSPILYATLWFAGSRMPQFELIQKNKAYKGGLAYYVFPGRAWAPDPLKAARKICADAPAGTEKVEWNLNAAIWYLQHTENSCTGYPAHKP